ncbi:unnamed protein product [Schistocephalus solidus]|uniref:BTB domain-containing protein n=1 Tax=Schistocephalus solidus TaxID=70667 RepID=A0A183TN58_SCHSO|nr:unnamed protein product [Schistocephalus solidus]
MTQHAQLGDDKTPSKFCIKFATGARTRFTLLFIWIRKHRAVKPDVTLRPRSYLSGGRIHQALCALIVKSAFRMAPKEEIKRATIGSSRWQLSKCSLADHSNGEDFVDVIVYGIGTACRGPVLLIRPSSELVRCLTREWAQRLTGLANRSSRAIARAGPLETHTRITNVLNGQKVYAHRIILAARIPALQESLANPDTSLSWSSYSQSAVEALLEYVYTGRASISQENAQNLLQMAKFLHMDTLEDWCIQFLVESINLACLSNLWLLSQDTASDIMQDTCLSVMRRIFDDFVSTDLFASLSAEALLQLIDNDDLRVSKEEAVLQAVLSWVTRDQEETSKGEQKPRVDNLHQLLPAIRWTEIPDESRKKLCGNPFIKANPKCL